MAHPDILNHGRAKQAMNDIATILKASAMKYKGHKQLTFKEVQIQVKFSY